MGIYKFVGIGVIPDRCLNRRTQLGTGEVVDGVAAKIGIGCLLHHRRVVQVGHGIFHNGTQVLCLIGVTAAGIKAAVFQLHPAVSGFRNIAGKQVAAESENGGVGAAGGCAAVCHQLAGIHQIEQPHRLAVGCDLMGGPCRKPLGVVLIVGRNGTQIRCVDVHIGIVGFGIGNHRPADQDIAHDHAHSQQQRHASLKIQHTNTPSCI